MLQYFLLLTTSQEADKSPNPSCDSSIKYSLNVISPYHNMSLNIIDQEANLGLHCKGGGIHPSISASQILCPGGKHIGIIQKISESYVENTDTKIFL